MNQNSFALTSSQLVGLGYFETIKLFPSLYKPESTIPQLYSIYFTHLQEHRLLFERIYLLITTHSYREESSSSSPYTITRKYHCDPSIFWTSIRKALVERGSPVSLDEISSQAKCSLYNYYYTQVHSRSSAVQFHPAPPNTLTSRLSSIPRRIPHHRFPLRFRSVFPTTKLQSPSHTAPVRTAAPVPSLLTLQVPTPTPVTRDVFIDRLKQHISIHFPSKMFFALFLKRSIKQFRAQHQLVFASVAKSIIALLPIVQRPLDANRSLLTFPSLLQSFLRQYPILPYLIFPFPFQESIISTYLTVQMLLPLQSLRKTPLFETPLLTFLNASIPATTMSSSTSTPSTSTDPPGTSASSSVTPTVPSSSSTSSPVTTVSFSSTTVASSSMATSSSAVVVWTPSNSATAPYLDEPPLTPGWDLPSITDRLGPSDDFFGIGDEVDSSTFASSLD
jgi:hypothetical protein